MAPSKDVVLSRGACASAAEPVAAPPPQPTRSKRREKREGLTFMGAIELRDV
jgi:hypothetical protein